MLNKDTETYRIGLLHLGFRPLFLFGSLFSIVAVAVWLWVLSYQGIIAQSYRITNVQWHAHEMIFGYVFAVIGGFLLTAESNWTGVKTLHGAPLLVLVLLWLLARLMPFVDYPHAVIFMAVFDLSFNIFLCLALLYPIVKARQRQHALIWIQVFIIVIANFIFYSNVLDLIKSSPQIGSYLALYIIISLIMVMAKRVVPFFIEKATSYVAPNCRWLDLTGLILLFTFIFFELIYMKPLIASIIALALSIVFCWRLKTWHTSLLWKKPLLWSLYLAYVWLAIGFIIKGVSYWGLVSPSLAIHAFAYGGIGMLTLGIMARVSLGHTGRDVFNPPGSLSVIFALLFVGGIFRVVFPVFNQSHYSIWVMIAQWLWILAFTGFLLLFGPMLIKKRIDGKYG